MLPPASVAVGLKLLGSTRRDHRCRYTGDLRRGRLGRDGEERQRHETRKKLNHSVPRLSQGTHATAWLEKKLGPVSSFSLRYVSVLPAGVTGIAFVA